jgi:hypothetical protein
MKYTYLPSILLLGEKKRDENNKIKGITNTAFTVGNADEEFYEVG